MDGQIEIEEIDRIKNDLINLILKVYSIISVPLLLVSLSGYPKSGWLPVYGAEVIIVVSLVIIYILKDRIRYFFKVIFIVSILFLIALMVTISYNLVLIEIIFFVLFVLFAALFLGRKLGYTALLLVMTILFIQDPFILNMFPGMNYNIADFIGEGFLWYSTIIVIGITIYSIVLILVKFEDTTNALLTKSIKNELDYKFLFEEATEGIIISDKHGSIELVNSCFSNLSGYAQDDVKGLGCDDLLSVPDLKKQLCFDELAKGEKIIRQGVIVDKWGKEKDIEIKANALPDGRLQMQVSDLSEKKKIQKEIEREKAFGKTLTEAMPGIFYVFENYDKLVQWNASLVAISGYTEKELQEIHPNDLFESGNYETVKDDIAQTGTKGSAYFKADLVTKKRKRVPLYNSAINYERDGKIYLMGMGYDITDLVDAEKALQNSEENFKNIYNNTGDAIFIFTKEFEILSANETFFMLTKIPHEELKTIKMFDFIFDMDALGKIIEEINLLDEQKVVVAEYQIQDYEGRLFPIEVRSRKILYEGKPAIVSAFNDISDRKSFEKQVYAVSVKAEEDERGRIAKDLHDGLGPLLSTCKIYLHNLKNTGFNAKEMKSFAKLTDLINESLGGVKEISNNLSPHILRNFGLVHALSSFIERLLVFGDINIMYHFDAPNRYDEIVEITLYRIATELLNNTLKYAQAKNVEVELIEKEGKLLFNYVDDGIGFDYEQMIQKKSGLGLFNIKSRIKSIGGSISFVSSDGAGVNVNIETNS